MIARKCISVQKCLSSKGVLYWKNENVVGNRMGMGMNAMGMGLSFSQ